MPGLRDIVSALGSIVGVRGLEEEAPNHHVERLAPDLDVRRYAGITVVETDMEGSTERERTGSAFGRLFRYISGENEGRAKVAMTAFVERASLRVPISAAVEQAGEAMRFALPVAFQGERAPVPRDPRVRIVHVPERTLAILRFSGTTPEATLSARQAELLQRLDGTGWRPAGAPLAMLYDPPFAIPALRRNEVAILVERG